MHCYIICFFVSKFSGLRRVVQNSPKNEGGELTADYRYSKEGVLGTCSSRVLQNLFTKIARQQSFPKALSVELSGKEYGIPDKSSLERPKKFIQYFMHYWAFLSSLSGVCRVRKRWGNIIDGRLAAMTVINVSSMYKRYKNTFEKGILLLWT